MNRPDLPILTFPKEVARFVRRTYASARYGSGGSTFVAAMMLGKRITSIESDSGWANHMHQISSAHDLQSPSTIVYVDIGPVSNWARAFEHQYFKKAHKNRP